MLLHSLRSIRKLQLVFLRCFSVLGALTLLFIILICIKHSFIDSYIEQLVEHDKMFEYTNVTLPINVKTDTPQKNDKKQYFDPFYYNWTLVERDFCTRRFRNLSLLIVVHTAVDHWKERQLIRDTWGNKKYYNEFRTTVIFAIGERNNETAQQRVIEESAIHNDIIQQNFTDTYRNLSLKAIMWLRFAADYCPHIPLILKIDDDIAFSYFNFMNIIAERQLFGAGFKPMSFICNVWNGMPVLRSGKWKITEEEYPNTTFSTYCSGSAYMLTNDLIKPLLLESRYCHLIWIDDFHITGHLAQKVNASFESIAPLYNFDGNIAQEAILNDRKIFSVTSTIEKRIEIWNHLQSKRSKNNSEIYEKFVEY